MFFQCLNISLGSTVCNVEATNCVQTNSLHNLKKKSYIEILGIYLTAILFPLDKTSQLTK